MQTMMHRIQELEKQVHQQTKEIIDKDHQLSKFEDQIAILQKANGWF